MSDSGYLLSVYLHLAAASQRRRRPHVRDRMLILAGALATRMALPLIAAYCRQQVLAHNPNHLVRRWATFETAVADEEFQCFLKQLQRRFPQEKAEQMLESLGIERGNERALYESDFEYAAALLGTTPQALQQRFG